MHAHVGMCACVCMGACMRACVCVTVQVGISHIAGD